jgi:thioredoxin 1
MSNNALRVVILIAVIAAAAAVFVMRPANQEGTTPTDSAVQTSLPKIVDLGADKCANCKKMVAILDGMKESQAEYFAVEFIDVWKDPEAAKPFAVSLIPTQVFLSASGEELFRHEGFFSREEILAKWNELGIKTGSL